MSAEHDRWLWQPGHVVRDGGRLWLEFPDVTRCARCRAGTGCGAASFIRLFRLGGTSRLPLASRWDGFEGQALNAGLNPRWLVWGAALLYLPPLLLFLTGALAVDMLLGGGDWTALGGGLFGAVAGMATTRRASRAWIAPRMRLEAAAALESTPACKHVLEDFVGADAASGDRPETRFKTQTKE